MATYLAFKLPDAVAAAKKTVAKVLTASLIGEHDLKQLVHTATGGEKPSIKWYVTQATKEVHAIVEVKSMENRKKVETALGKKGAKYNKSYRVDSPVVWVDVSPKGFEEHFEDKDKVASELVKIAKMLVEAAEPELLSVRDNFEHYRVGKFHYIADDNEVHVTKDSGGSHNNVASYTYRNHGQACDAAYGMALKQSKA